MTFTVVARNEFSPVCKIQDDRSVWSIMENSAYGTIIGTIFCQDDDQDEPNGMMTAHTYWFPDQYNQNRTIPAIPFDIKTTRNNTLKVRYTLNDYLK